MTRFLCASRGATVLDRAQHPPPSAQPAFTTGGFGKSSTASRGSWMAQNFQSELEGSKFPELTVSIESQRKYGHELLFTALIRCI
jgi:hypothetical protein